MKKDKLIKVKVNLNKINLSEPIEVMYWTRRFRCSREALRRAVKAVGTGPTKVEKYLHHK